MADLYCFGMCVHLPLRGQLPHLYGSSRTGQTFAPETRKWPRGGGPLPQASLVVTARPTLVPQPV